MYKTLFELGKSLQGMANIMIGAVLFKKYFDTHDYEYLLAAGITFAIIYSVSCIIIFIAENLEKGEKNV